jgi:hypothetical protein
VDTPLHLALTKLDSTLSLEELISYGADLEAPGGMGRTPLVTACRDNSCNDAIEHLLLAGANINAVDASGISALDHYMDEYSSKMEEPHDPDRDLPDYRRSLMLVACTPLPDGRVIDLAARCVEAFVDISVTQAITMTTLRRNMSWSRRALAVHGFAQYNSGLDLI